MRYAELLDQVGPNAIFESALLTDDATTTYQVQRRLSDWTSAGKIVPLRRGLYTLPREKRARDPHPFYVANRIVDCSYVSLEMALGYHQLIPEHVAIVTSVTTGRPGTWINEFGRFTFRHVRSTYFFGMEHRELIPGQYAFVATPEKALLDLIYLRRGGDSPAFIRALRLQNLDQLDLSRLQAFAAQFGKPKLARAALVIANLAREEAAEYESL